jgi:hypothetical protein
VQYRYIRHGLSLTLLLIGILVGSWFASSVSAQGPFTAQIQRAINALLSGGFTFTVLNLNGTANVNQLCLDNANRDACVTRAAANLIGLASGDRLGLPDGSASAPSLTFASDPLDGLFKSGSDQIGVVVAGGHYIGLGANITLRSGGQIGWSTNTAPLDGNIDVALLRGAADRLDLATGASFNLVSGTISLAGRPTVTVDAATTFAVANSYMILACTGVETINTITGGRTGLIVWLENSDTECTIADDDDPTAADAVDLTGTATNDIGAVKKVIGLMYNGSSWLQIFESDN